MSISKRMKRVFNSAAVIPFDDDSKFVFLSDCHRGDGSGADNFLKNQNLYSVAMNHYYDSGYTYIELGDGDELWENNSFCSILDTHGNSFKLLSRFHIDNRFYQIYGNHDMVKKNKKWVQENLCTQPDEHERKEIPLFLKITIHEGLILKHKQTQNKIFLLHGHQADFFNDRLWKLSRFLVRYLWRPLQLIGVRDPMSASKNNTKKQAIEKNLMDWAFNNKQMLVAGHTHRPAFPRVGEAAYFNDGCCVHPRCITALEIANGNIALVKWSVKTKKDGTLFVDRTLLKGPAKLQDYFDAIRH